jgi:hypothetical protein
LRRIPAFGVSLFVDQVAISSLGRIHHTDAFIQRAIIGFFSIAASLSRNRSFRVPRIFDTLSILASP